MPAYSARFMGALGYAGAVHGADVRKGSQTPYVGHLLGVCALVVENGGSEDQAIAALLHDAAEDKGGERRLAEIETLFGAEVERIVRACSDSLLPEGEPKAPWRERKERYLEHLAAMPGRAAGRPPDPALLVSLADKVDNARAIVRDYEQLGEDLWQRFTTRSGDDQVWYYRELANAYAAHGMEGAMLDELRRLVARLEQRRPSTPAQTPAATA
jgi:(p)ppGpp synthase/HD superfamily hydrolase